LGSPRRRHPVEWLSDNGSAYIDTATALGLKLCFTPVRSPESNGIAEAFVKTFKRDYAQLSILSDAETVIALLPAWFEDYTCISPRAASTTPGCRRVEEQACVASACPCHQRTNSYLAVDLGRRQGFVP
jgi:Integrase core domain